MIFGSHWLSFYGQNNLNIHPNIFCSAETKYFVFCWSLKKNTSLKQHCWIYIHIYLYPIQEYLHFYSGTKSMILRVQFQRLWNCSFSKSGVFNFRESLNWTDKRKYKTTAATKHIHHWFLLVIMQFRFSDQVKSPSHVLLRSFLPKVPFLWRWACC